MPGKRVTEWQSLHIAEGQQAADSQVDVGNAGVEDNWFFQVL